MASHPCPLPRPLESLYHASSASAARVWYDVVGAQTILSLPKERMHAEADQEIVRHAIVKDVGVMLVLLGQLWGRGTGLLKKESQTATYYAAVRRRGRAFVVRDWSAAWSWALIRDLGGAVVFLMERAAMSWDARRR